MSRSDAPRDPDRASASPVAFGGRTACRLTTEHVQAQDTGYAPDLRLPSHYHSEPIVTMPLRGRFELRAHGRRVICQPGTIFTMPAGETHASVFGVAGARSVIITPRDLAGWLSTATRTFFSTRLVVESPPIAQLAARIADEAQAADNLSALAVDGIVMQIVALTLRTDRQLRLGVRPPCLERARQLIHAAASHQLTLSELATEVDTTPSYLARTFRAAYGMSIARYARTLRFDRASERLRSTADAIRDIAHDAGFADQSHFTRVFRRIKGVTPARYRRDIGQRTNA